MLISIFIAATTVFLSSFLLLPLSSSPSPSPLLLFSSSFSCFIFIKQFLKDAWLFNLFFLFRLLLKRAHHYHCPLLLLFLSLPFFLYLTTYYTVTDLILDLCLSLAVKKKKKSSTLINYSAFFFSSSSSLSSSSSSSTSSSTPPPPLLLSPSCLMQNHTFAFMPVSCTSCHLKDIQSKANIIYLHRFWHLLLLLLLLPHHAP